MDHPKRIFARCGSTSQKALADASGSGQGLNDGWILKIDAQGSPPWERTFEGLGYDAFGSIQQTSDGGFIVSGYLQTNPRVSDTTDAFVLKIDDDEKSPHCHIMDASSPRSEERRVGKECRSRRTPAE